MAELRIELDGEGMEITDVFDRADGAAPVVGRLGASGAMMERTVG